MQIKKYKIENAPLIKIQCHVEVSECEHMHNIKYKFWYREANEERENVCKEIK
jgi:hypothetical protein